jgi:general secretion pathway protein H
MTGRKESACEGYTLMEALVVLGILALVLSLTLTTMPKRSERSLEAEGAAISAVLRDAAIRAISRNVEVAVAVDPARKTIAVDSSQVLLLRDDIDLTLTAARSEIAGGQAKIRFYPDGSSTGGSLELRRGDVSVAIHVQWLTGQIRRDAAIVR